MTDANLSTFAACLGRLMLDNPAMTVAITLLVLTSLYMNAGRTPVPAGCVLLTRRRFPLSRTPLTTPKPIKVWAAGHYWIEPIGHEIVEVSNETVYASLLPYALDSEHFTCTSLEGFDITVQLNLVMQIVDALKVAEWRQYPELALPDMVMQDIKYTAASTSAADILTDALALHKRYVHVCKEQAGKAEAVADPEDATTCVEHEPKFEKHGVRFSFGIIATVFDKERGASFEAREALAQKIRDSNAPKQ